MVDWIAKKPVNVISKMMWADNLSKEGELKEIINYDMNNVVKVKII